MERTEVDRLEKTQKEVKKISLIVLFLLITSQAYSLQPWTPLKQHFFRLKWLERVNSDKRWMEKDVAYRDYAMEHNLRVTVCRICYQIIKVDAKTDSTFICISHDSLCGECRIKYYKDWSWFTMEIKEQRKEDEFNMKMYATKVTESKA